MTATIQKWGNSLALRIPLAVAKQIHVKEGDPVTLKVGASGLTVKAAPKKVSLRRLAQSGDARKPPSRDGMGCGCRPGGPAIVLSHTRYNEKTGLAAFCPIAIKVVFTLKTKQNPTSIVEYKPAIQFCKRHSKSLRRLLDSDR